MSGLVVTIPGEIESEIVKWKVKKGSQIGVGNVLCLYKIKESDVIQKLKSNHVGTVIELCFQEGDKILPGATVVKLAGCTHPTVMKDMCAECGADLRQIHGMPGDRKSNVSASVAMVHSVPELIVSEQQAMELGREDEVRMLRNRKLALLVDLDQTLIHTTNDNIPANLKDVYHFQQWHGPAMMWYHTKFRPGTEHFLEQISKLFEMHIVTFGARMYAHTIGKFLDPDGKFFSHRILSRDECFNATSKTANLKALFPRGDSMVCIIDDREDVWNFVPNLVQVKPYIFFDGTADINAPPGLEKGAIKHEFTKHKYRIIRVPREKHNQKMENSEVGEKCKINVNNEEEKCKSNDTVKEIKTKDECVTKSSEVLSGQNKRDSVEQNINASESEVSNKQNLENNESILPNLETDKCISENTCNEAERKEVDKTNIENDNSESNKESKEEIEHVKEIYASNEGDGEYEEIIEWEDNDDYLIYLEDVLTRIHTAFFELYDQTQKKDNLDELPNLKKIIPYVKRKVFQGLNIVFSGVIPMNAPLEKSRAYKVVKSLGANVQESFTPRDGSEDENATTHVIAARSGTTKVKAAKKQGKVKIVNPDWLWVCAERWERVDERLFPLKDDKNFPPPQDSPVPRIKCKSEKRKKNDSDHSAECRKKAKSPKLSGEADDDDESDESESSKAGPSTVSEERRFSDSYNPLYVFSSEDIENMDKEVEEIFGESDSEDSETEMRRIVLGEKRKETSSEESMSGDFPKGWGHKKKQSLIEEDENKEEAEEEEPNVDQPHRLFKHSDSSSNDGNSDNSFNESIGSVDEEMAAAVEREFLSF